MAWPVRSMQLSSVLASLCVLLELLQGCIAADAAAGAGGMQRAPRPPVRDRLAVLILYAHHAPVIESKMPLLKESLESVAKNVMPWTPLDVLIWYHTPIPDQHKEALSAIMDGNCQFIRIDDHEWQEPPYMQAEARNFSLKLPTRVRWTNKEAPLEVRRSGLWHITKPFQYAAAHGYEFALKWDQDIVISSSISVSLNLVDHFRAKGLDVGHMGWLEDGLPNLIGLAEITRYYITTQSPPVHQLFEHCQPPDINGLFWNDNGNRGWDGKYYGHGIMMRTSLFTGLQTAEFLRVIAFTGGMYRHRWHENAVYSLLSLIWVSKDKTYEFGFGFTHGNVNKAAQYIP